MNPFYNRQKKCSAIKRGFLSNVHFYDHLFLGPIVLNAHKSSMA